MKWVNVPAAVLLAHLSACASAPRDEGGAEIRQQLMGLERDSHQRWLDRDADALEQLMADGFHFVAMNGALETKELIVGGARSDGPRTLEIESLRVDPEEVILHSDTAVVVSLLHIEATVRGRRLPSRMRILSVFDGSKEDGDWHLIARSITPILTPPPP